MTDAADHPRRPGGDVQPRREPLDPTPDPPRFPWSDVILTSILGAWSGFLIGAMIGDVTHQPAPLLWAVCLAVVGLVVADLILFRWRRLRRRTHGRGAEGSPYLPDGGGGGDIGGT